MKNAQTKNLSVCRSAILALILVWGPQTTALASDGATLPFDDPTWKALVLLALLVNACLYALVWRRRTN